MRLLHGWIPVHMVTSLLERACRTQPISVSSIEPLFLRLQEDIVHTNIGRYEGSMANHAYRGATPSTYMHTFPLHEVLAYAQIDLHVPPKNTLVGSQGFACMCSYVRSAYCTRNTRLYGASSSASTQHHQPILGTAPNQTFFSFRTQPAAFDVPRHLGLRN